ncbi:helix-turn-helix domain-containing protein [Parahaliea mediterranea]|uniref:helix-turn-helix domain-containing protein n=1 Tax=Parahaliea mediterranea TaxID=651086 RepID=UPI0013005F48|nr:XRE family transcriptional regulator [Parahaliea mediterranea]
MASKKTARKNSAADVTPPANMIGRRLRQLRKDHDWTLAEVAEKTGISVGTLSKLEHGKTQLNFTSVNKLANGLGLPVTDLTNPVSAMQGRRAITPGGQGAVFEALDMEYEVLCSDVSNHQQGYLKAVVKSRVFDPELPWHRHHGQEFLYVLSGKLELHTELYQPVQLSAGDSILFDSSMGHHYVSLGRKDAHILMSMSLEGYQNVSDIFRT